MGERIPKRFCISCGLLMAIDASVALAYLWYSTSNILLTSWVLAGSELIGSLFC